MKKVTVEYNVYGFEELGNKAKQAAIQNYRESLDSTDFNYDGVYESIIEEAKKYGITIQQEDIAFTGFWCQGDGASFVSNDIDLSKFIEVTGIQFKRKALRNVIVKYANPVIYRDSSHYYHKNTVTGSADVHFYAEEEYPRLYQAVLKKEREINEKLKEVKDTLCDKLYKELQEEYEYRTSDETISEILASDEFQFLENGKEFSEVA